MNNRSAKLWLAFAALPKVIQDMRLPLLQFVGCAFGLLAVRYFFPHYAAPLTVTMILLLVQQLEATPGKHLVIVHYAPELFADHEWVYNDADIDGSKIVWAREKPTPEAYGSEDGLGELSARTSKLPCGNGQFVWPPLCLGTSEPHFGSAIRMCGLARLEAGEIQKWSRLYKNAPKRRQPMRCNPNAPSQPFFGPRRLWDWPSC